MLLTPLPVRGHLKQVQVTGNYEITYFSNPPDPLAGSQATLFIQVRNVTTDVQLRVYHFFVEMIPPSGPRVIQHPVSNSTLFTFNEPGNWVLLFDIGLSPDLGVFDTTATFVADVSRAQTSGLLAAFANVLAVTIPRVYARWGHIFAVVLWLGMMLHVVNTYRLSPDSHSGMADFARTFRRADIFVALAIGLLVSTGIARAFAHGLTTLPSLFASDFGLVLFTKILLAAGMIAIGFFNRAFMLRRLENAIAQDGATPTSALKCGRKDPGRLAQRMHYLTLLEIGLGVSAILFGTIFTQIHTIT